MITVFREKGYLDFSFINVNDKPISYTLGFLFYNKYYHWSVGFDIDYAQLSPNKVHHMLLFQSFFIDGISEFNFMRGNTSYKLKWTQTYRNSYEFKIWNNISAYGKFLSGIKKIRASTNK